MGGSPARPMGGGDSSGFSVNEGLHDGTHWTSTTRTVQYVTDLLRKHLKAIRSRWRSLPAGRIVVIVLAVPRPDQHEHPRTPPPAETKLVDLR